MMFCCMLLRILRILRCLGLRSTLCRLRTGYRWLVGILRMSGRVGILGSLLRCCTLGRRSICGRSVSVYEGLPIHESRIFGRLRLIRTVGLGQSYGTVSRCSLVWFFCIPYKILLPPSSRSEGKLILCFFHLFTFCCVLVSAYWAY